MSPKNGKMEAEASPQNYQSLTSVERGFSFHVAATRCEEVSDQLVRLAELLRCTRPDPSAPECPLSQCAMVKSTILGRRLRDRFFDGALFADPSWDILLDLYLARLEQRRTKVSSLCIAAAVPATTALRHINSLVEREMIVRIRSQFDNRAVYVELGDSAFEAMQAYFDRFTELLSAASGR